MTFFIFHFIEFLRALSDAETSIFLQIVVLYRPTYSLYTGFLFKTCSLTLDGKTRWSKPSQSEKNGLGCLVCFVR